MTDWRWSIRRMCTNDRKRNSFGERVRVTSQQNGHLTLFIVWFVCLFFVLRFCSQTTCVLYVIGMKLKWIVMFLPVIVFFSSVKCSKILFFVFCSVKTCYYHQLDKSLLSSILINLLIAWSLECFLFIFHSSGIDRCQWTERQNNRKQKLKRKMTNGTKDEKLPNTNR